MWYKSSLFENFVYTKKVWNFIGLQLQYKKIYIPCYFNAISERDRQTEREIKRRRDRRDRHPERQTDIQRQKYREIDRQTDRDRQR